MMKNYFNNSMKRQAAALLIVCAFLASCSKFSPAGYYVEKGEGSKIASTWRFKSDGTVMQGRPIQAGMVGSPGKWTIDGDRVVVTFVPSQVEQGYVPQEQLVFEVEPSGNLISPVGGSKTTILKLTKMDEKTGIPVETLKASRD